MRDHPALEIKAVAPGSLAAVAGIKAGHRLESINGQPLADEFDYRFAQAEEALSLSWLDLEGQRHVRRIAKHPDQDLGLDFSETPFRTCKVKCVFCFIDQNPKGMRSSIYFKDEDYRFSWLYGNYVTLFNMSEEDLEKAISRRMSPMYVSVHATDEAVRRPLLGVKKDTLLMPRLRRLAEAGIQLHCQVVVVPGLNDGAVLEATVRDLAGLHPSLASVALVPVGLTRHRQHLPSLRLNTRAEARALLKSLAAWQHDFLRRLGTRLVFAADEWYLKAGQALPLAGDYEEFPQLGNGVGSVRGFVDGFARRLGRAQRKSGAPGKVLALTGRAFAPTLQASAQALQARVAGLKVQVLGVENRLYGRTVSVAGLLCGADLAEAAAGLGADRVLVPDVMLRDRAGLFLDNTSPAWLEQQIKAPVKVVPADAAGFLKGCCQ